MSQKLWLGPSAAALAIFLLMGLALVHCVGWLAPATAQRSPTPKPPSPAAPRVYYGTAELPGPVQEMREAILSAVRSGRIEDLRYAYELNELKPELASEPVADPVAFWRQLSGDGQGFEVLAALGQILDAGYVVQPLGRDLENNRIYVWPYFAEVPLEGLTAPQEVELMRLMGVAVGRQLKANGRYASWRLAIGADGVWHSFRRAP
jgi:hypothetical protein